MRHLSPNKTCIRDLQETAALTKKTSNKKTEVETTKWVQMFIIRVKMKSQLTLEGN